MQGEARFPTTRWSIVVAARHEDEQAARTALASLCAQYWQPVFAFVRRQGYSSDEAQDLTQGFFATLIEFSDGSSRAEAATDLEGDGRLAGGHLPASPPFPSLWARCTTSPIPLRSPSTRRYAPSRQRPDASSCACLFRAPSPRARWITSPGCIGLMRILRRPASTHSSIPRSTTR